MALDDKELASEQAQSFAFSFEDLQKACGRTIAFVLAFGAGPLGDLRSIIDAALGARMPAVFVLGSPEHADEVMEAVRRFPHRKNAVLQALEYDESAGASMMPESGTFTPPESSDYSYGLLVTVRAVAESVLDDYDSVVLIDATQESTSIEEVYELCRDAKAPQYLTRDFLESL